MLTVLSTLSSLSIVLALASQEPTAETAPALDQAALEALSAEIAAEVEALRGRRFERPVAVAVADAAAFERYVQKRMDESTTPEELAATEAVAKLTAVIPPEMDLLDTVRRMLASQVGGFYDPAADTFYLMDRFTGGLARIILAHELTHALDDQLYDLDGTMRALLGESDALFAYQALVEGSGTAVMTRWAIEHRHELDPSDLEGGDAVSMDSLADLPAAVWKPLLAVYLRGATFLNRTDSMIAAQMRYPPPADFARAFADPPRSSEQILHPEKYWSEEERDEPLLVAIEAGALPDGWSLAYRDSLGEIGLAHCTTPLGERGGLKGSLQVLGARYTNAAAEGWGGDRFALLEREGAQVLIGVTVWDTERDALEFAEALRGLSAHVEGTLATLARVAGAQQSAYAIETGAASAALATGPPEESAPTARTVVFRCAYGAAPAELDALARAVSYTVAPPAEAVSRSSDERDG